MKGLKAKGRLRARNRYKRMKGQEDRKLKLRYRGGK